MASHGFVCLFSSERSYLPVFTFIPHLDLETSSRLHSFTDTISQHPQKPPWHPELCSLNSPPMLSPHDSTRLNWELNVSWNILQWSEMISCSYWFCKQVFISRQKFKKLFHCLCNFLATNEIKTCLSHTYVVWGGSDAPSPAGLALLSCPDEVQDLLFRMLQLVRWWASSLVLGASSLVHQVSSPASHRWGEVGEGGHLPLVHTII